MVGVTILALSYMLTNISLHNIVQYLWGGTLNKIVGKPVQFYFYICF